MTFKELLEAALEQTFGLEVATKTPDRLRAKLYAEKRKDERFECLSFSVPPKADTLMIYNRTVLEDGETET